MALGRPLNNRWIDLRILIPAFTVVLLLGMWGIAYNFIQVKRESSEREAVSAARAVADAYEAQIVRNLREIHNTLKTVKYEYESALDPTILSRLQEQDRLPPELFFQVRIADSMGNIVASTKAGPPSNVAVHQYFNVHREPRGLWVGEPFKDTVTNKEELPFSLRLNDKAGRFAGVAILTVNADYFVSGYDFKTMGKHGVLALVGQDGIVRVRRSGNSIVTDERMDYSQLLEQLGEDGDVTLLANGWDKVPRYTSLRELYEFSLGIVIGLAQAEQLASADEQARNSIRWAAGATLVILLFMGALARMSWQIVRKDERIRHLAYHDALTGLPNRMLLLDRLQQHLRLAQREPLTLGVLFVDLDRFKAINDTFGHEVGDALLKELANRLTKIVRQSDTVARIGGDEFIVLLKNVQAPANYAIIAQKIIDQLSAPVPFDEHHLQVGVSIGIACFPDDSSDPSELMKYADTAMYSAKAAGRGMYRFFQSLMADQALQQLGLEAALRNAIANDELELFYQPKITLATEEVCGVEALVRWNRPGQGLVPPNDFIPIAEETGLICEIGDWVLEAACRQARDWKERQLGRFRIAVNVSARQLQRVDLAARILELTQQYAVEPSCLEIELTESVIMADAKEISAVFARLRAAGVTVAVDDFGTGYSSLAYLQRLPIDVLKIDRAFVKNLGGNHEDEEIVKVILALGRTLKLAVVAEGVETQVQADVLRRYGCAMAQGYLYSKPRPAHEIEAWIAESMAAKR